jgi:uncharacterized protein YggE
VAVVAVIVAVFVAILISYSAFGNGVQRMRTISVYASGSASAVPAEAEIQVFMNATGKTAALANANLSSGVAAMNSTILPLLGGNASLIQTTSYVIYQATNCTYATAAPYYCISQKLPYYAASEGFEISVPGIKNASRAITALSGLPSLQLNGVQAALSRSQQAALGQEALSAALANATGQAQLLAGSGASIEVENITVQSSGIYYPVVYSTGSKLSASVSGGSSVFFGGSATVQKSISVVFGIR